MNDGLFTGPALRELRDAASWIAEDNTVAAEALLLAAVTAARMLVQHPERARVEVRLAPVRYRFWSLRGFPYLLVIDTEGGPPVVARFVHQARGLPAALNDA